MRNMMNQKTYMKIRVSMLNSLVRSRLTYGCQTWNCNMNQMSKLNSTYMGYIRRMVKGGFNRREESWRFQYTNNDLLRISNTPDICTFVRNQQSIYVKKILLKNNDSIVVSLVDKPRCLDQYCNHATAPLRISWPLMMIKMN